MKKVVVLGAGMVGSVMAADLAKDFDVLLVDINEKTLAEVKGKYGIKIQSGDLSDNLFLSKVIEDKDLVIGSVPGFMGYETLRKVIEAGKNIIDISFFGEDPFGLDELAREKNVIAVVDCGVAPGMSNVLAGYYDSKIRMEFFECLVGGLPFQRTWPYEYKAPFSPIDVLEEYTRPARLKEHGEIVEKVALSEPELVDLPPIGTLEAFNTDGLRSLLTTITAPNMREKTLRFPGHIEKMRMLRESGFLSKTPIDINGTAVIPLEFTTKLLFPLWKLDPEEREFTIMRITIRGEDKGVFKEYQYDLFDRYEESTGYSSMARTTGFTCTVVARLVLDGTFTRKGISPPEFLGAEEGCLEAILDGLEQRNITYRKQERTIG